MTFTRNVYVPAKTLERIDQFITKEPRSKAEAFAEDRSITYTAQFKHGYTAEICCHGVRYEENKRNTACTSATLLLNDKVVDQVDAYRFTGYWTLRHDDNFYRIVVLPKEEDADISIDPRSA